MLYDKNPCYDNFDMKFLVAPEHVATFEMALEEFASAVLTMPIEKGEHKGMWEVQAIFETKPDIQDIERAMAFASQMCGISQPEWALNEMEKKNWLKESLISFPPVTIGKYYIYGSHIKDAPPADKIALQIDAATAFGSGEHQTTQGCLTALNELAEKPKKVIDVGCGSGILAMAYAKTFNALVDAVDIDPESVLVTSNSAKINGLDHLMRVWESDGYKGVNDQYDLVFCNILARPLINMASDLKDHLTSGGMAILSGFLIRQERWVLKAHTDIGLKFVAKYRINGWSTLVVRKD
ncbi:MAG: 50S ribosomal protein L11 methyltransferase [Alphaproteobacteria bacterium]|nr:50S ribosomal protein L11 methyltransferase [Alphaproteobacteria bacterium]